MIARIGFGIAIIASLAMGGWFLFSELNSPGISFAVAFFGMHLLLACFGFFKIQQGGITKDGKGLWQSRTRDPSRLSAEYLLP